MSIFNMKETKRFIAPGAWFSMDYPADWNEFEDSEEAFLFYNPNVWTGNFRISAYRGNASYGPDSVEQELRENTSARRIKIGAYECAYSQEMFMEGENRYVSHIWVAGSGDIVFECTFTTGQDKPVDEAEGVIASLRVRQAGMKYPAELIPVRISEIYQIDEAYEWVEKTVKEVLKKDFQGVEDDIQSMQELVDKGVIPPKKRERWLALGIVLCVILNNEVDGLEWRTLIDGNREAPVLLNLAAGTWTDPMKLTWSKVKAGGKVNLVEAYVEACQA